MIATEELQRRVNEFYDGIRSGEFESIENIPEKYTYGHLLGLFHVVNQGGADKELFKLFYNCIKLYSRGKLRQKALSGAKIKVAFMVISAAEWPAEHVYRALEKDDRFEPYIIGLRMTDKSPEALDRTYRLNKEYFTSRDYNYIDGVSKDGTCPGWESLGVPDICIHLSPWWENIPDNQSVPELPISCVNFYIPYGFYVANSVDKTFSVKFVYNKDFMSLMDAVFIDSMKNAEGFRKHQVLEGENIVYSGYTKMDYFYSKHSFSPEDINKIWKIPKGEDPLKTPKIIIAPHHSIGDDWAVRFSTFDKNYSFFYYLAKKRQDISFIYKPHPNLGANAVLLGLFNDQAEYLEYIEKWNSLPNAKVMEEGSYLEVFETSTAMIQDSASFLAEYLYTKKPMLYLTRRGQEFNECGKVLYEVSYKCDGRDYVGIESFIDNVVIKGEDSNLPAREKVFSKDLDYYSHNGKEAWEYISDYISSLLA